MCIFIVNNGLSTCNTIGNEKKRVHCKQTRWKFLRFGHSLNNLILRIRNIENSCWTRSHVMTVSHHESVCSPLYITVDAHLSCDLYHYSTPCSQVSPSKVSALLDSSPHHLISHTAQSCNFYKLKEKSLAVILS